MEISLSQVRANRVGMKQELKKVEEMDRKGNTKLFKENKMVTPKSMKNWPGLIYGCVQQVTTKNKSESSLRRQIPNPYAGNVVFLKGKISLFVE